MRSAGWRRAPALALAVVLSALIAACGSGTRTAHRPAPRPKVATLRGSLLRVRATTLVVRESAGTNTVRVTFAPTATPIYAVTRVTAAAIQPGSCVAVRGDREATGTVVASALVVTSSVDDTCPAGAEPLPPPPVDSSRSPSPPPPLVSPSPPPLPGPAVVSGQVLSLGGGALGIEPSQGDPQVVLLSRDVPVFFFQPSGRSALVLPSCVVVQGTRSRRGLAAHRIVDWPPGTEC